MRKKFHMSEPSLNRTLHTNVITRVLQVSKTLDLFFRNKSAKNAAPSNPISLAYLHCEDEVGPKLLQYRLEVCVKYLTARDWKI